MRMQVQGVGKYRSLVLWIGRGEKEGRRRWKWNRWQSNWTAWWSTRRRTPQRSTPRAPHRWIKRPNRLQGTSHKHRRHHIKRNTSIGTFKRRETVQFARTWLIARARNLPIMIRSICNTGGYETDYMMSYLWHRWTTYTNNDHVNSIWITKYKNTRTLNSLQKLKRRSEPYLNLQ